MFFDQSKQQFGVPPTRAALSGLGLRRGKRRGWKRRVALRVGPDGRMRQFVKPPQLGAAPRSNGKAVEPAAGVQLLAYLKQHEPRAWSAIVRLVPAAAVAVHKSGAGMHGLAQDDLIDAAAGGSAGIDWGGIINNAVTAGSGVLQLIQNQNLFKANLQRAQQGKPPLTPQQTAAMVQPVRAAATVGLDPQTRKMLTYFAVGAGVLLAGGIGIAAFAKRGAGHHRRYM